jgi:hypothetical protein
MPDDRFGIGMLVMGVGVINPLIHQVTESAISQHMGIAFWQIATQGIDRYLQHQPRGGVASAAVLIAYPGKPIFPSISPANILIAFIDS